MGIASILKLPPATLEQARESVRNITERLAQARTEAAEAEQVLNDLLAGRELGDEGATDDLIQRARVERDRKAERVEAAMAGCVAASKRLAEAEEADREFKLQSRWAECRELSVQAEQALKSIEKNLAALNKDCAKYIEVCDDIRRRSPYVDERPDNAMHLAPGPVSGRLMRHVKFGLKVLFPELDGARYGQVGFAEERTWLKLHSDKGASS